MIFCQHHKKLKIIARHQLNIDVWDACVSSSCRRIVYGYTWYLDAVLPAPEWKWVGIVLLNESGQYQAVLPVPLRRKAFAGITYKWVVHQPFFCQFLGVFSSDETIDSGPFFQKMADEFGYGSIYCTRHHPSEQFNVDFVESRTTHILNLLVGYDTIYQNYTQDRRANLRRALMANWSIVESNDPEPLLVLFREYHANTIEGGVANESYAIFRTLFSELKKRKLALLRYAIREGKIEAGALFVQEGGRLIYLFNAASETGRKGNARTLLVDQLIREQAGQTILLDFESPAKPSIRDYYRSFGALEEPFWAMRWNRLNWVERLLLTALQRLR